MTAPGHFPRYPGIASPSLGDIAQQISDHEHPAPPSTGPAR